MDHIEITIDCDLTAMGESATSADHRNWCSFVGAYVRERHEGADIDVLTGDRADVRTWASDDTDRGESGESRGLRETVRAEVADAWQAWLRARAQS